MIVLVREDKFNFSTDGRLIHQYIVDTNDIPDKDIKIWIESLMVDVIADGDAYNDETEVHPMYASLNKLHWYEIDQSDTIEAPFKVERVVTFTK